MEKRTRNVENTQVEPVILVVEAVPVHCGKIWLWRVLKCPFCGKKHVHGGGCIGEPPLGGTRVSHCVPGAGKEYRLLEVQP